MQGVGFDHQYFCLIWNLTPVSQQSAYRELISPDSVFLCVEQSNLLSIVIL